MKFLILLLLAVSCTNKNQTSEVPTLPPVVIAEVETYKNDPDCGRPLPNDFNKMVSAALKDKVAILKKSPDAKYWQAFFKSLAKAESCLKQNLIYVEPKSLGKDAVTGKQNQSEGYFQMSYQDAKYHGCAFDYAKDKTLPVTSLEKTIYSPLAQINCAAIVLNKQLEEAKPLYSPYYWSVLGTRNAKGHKDFLRYLKSEGY